MATLFRCGCGYQGGEMQVWGHKRSHGRRPERWPLCQGEPERVAGGEAPAPAIVAEATVPSPTPAETPARAQQPGNGRPHPVETAGEGPEGTAETAETPNGEGDGYAGQLINATLQKYPITVTPVLLTLWDSLREHEGLTDPFEVWLEKSTLQYWAERGYRVTVSVSGPDRLVPVAG